MSVGEAVEHAFGQTWPPFLLVAGLLLIGAVAASDGLFEALGSRLARLPGGGLVLFLSLMLLVVSVTVVLNLDTSVVFLTPIVLHAARRRGIPETAFTYGVIFLSNSASLLLPGSNLTNLLVLLPEHGGGGTYAARMAPAWAAAVVVSAAVVMAWRWRDLRHRQEEEVAAVPLRLGLGLVGIVAATVFVLVFENPALFVVATGVLLAVVQVGALRRLHARAALAALSAVTLGAVFAVAVALGTLARLWAGPGHLMASIGPWPQALVGAGATTVVNNLPATMLLASRAPSHPLAMLVGVNLGPNLVVWGALSGLLWLRVAKAHGAAPSARTYTAVGVVLVPLSMVAALAVLG